MSFSKLVIITAKSVELKEYHKTIKYFKKALEVSAIDDADIYYNVGNTLSSIEEHAEVISYFDNVL